LAKLILAFSHADGNAITHSYQAIHKTYWTDRAVSAEPDKGSQSRYNNDCKFKQVSERVAGSIALHLQALRFSRTCDSIRIRRDKSYFAGAAVELATDRPRVMQEELAAGRDRRCLRMLPRQWPWAAYARSVTSERMAAQQEHCGADSLLARSWPQIEGGW